MGSLLPGWDSEPIKPQLGLPEELREEILSLEKGEQMAKRKSVEGRTMALPIGRPDLSRKSAPSVFVIQKLQEAFPDGKDASHTESGESDDAENEEPPTHKATETLFRRDKWWRKFSSAHLNEMAREAEKDFGTHTYTPQFDLAGGDPYLKKKVNA